MVQDRSERLSVPRHVSGQSQYRTVSHLEQTMRHANEKTTLLRRRQRRQDSGQNPSARTAAHRRRSAAGSLSLEGTRPDQRHLGPTAETKTSEARVHFLNRIHFLTFLPYDCQDVDWELLPEQITDRQRAHTSAAAASERIRHRTAERDSHLKAHRR